MIFNAFRLTNLQDLKVQIVSQDPGHKTGQSIDLSFSVPKNCKVPPSLRNIFKAINVDSNTHNFKIKKHGDLSCWAKQVVFLLSDVLMVRDSSPASYKPSKWTDFIDFVIRCLNKEKFGIVFLLWRNPAQMKARQIG